MMLRISSVFPTWADDMMTTSSTPASFTASMISRWYGARSVFHCPGSADASWDSFLYLSAQPLTVSSGGGDRIFAINLKRRTVFPSTFLSPIIFFSLMITFISLNVPCFAQHVIYPQLHHLFVSILQFLVGFHESFNDVFPLNPRG